MYVLLALFIGLGLIIAVLTYFSRKNKTQETEIVVNNTGECCGVHEVCDKDSLLATDSSIEYFDDEELDTFACMHAELYSLDQIQQFEDVFYTLQASEMAAWLRSLQKRRIELPLHLRDAALMVVSERRG